VVLLPDHQIGYALLEQEKTEVTELLIKASVHSVSSCKMGFAIRKKAWGVAYESPVCISWFKPGWHRRFGQFRTDSLRHGTCDQPGEQATDAVGRGPLVRIFACEPPRPFNHASVPCPSALGKLFDAIVTGASDKGIWVRLSQQPVEGKLDSVPAGLQVSDRLRVQLISTDLEPGFIDLKAVGERLAANAGS